VVLISLYRLLSLLQFNKQIGETPSKVTRKFLIFLCLMSSTCLKSENEIKFANVSRDIDLFEKNVTMLMFTHVMHDAILFTISIRNVTNCTEAGRQLNARNSNALYLWLL